MLAMQIQPFFTNSAVGRSRPNTLSPNMFDSNLGIKPRGLWLKNSFSVRFPFSGRTLREYACCLSARRVFRRFSDFRVCANSNNKNNTTILAENQKNTIFKVYKLINVKFKVSA